MIYSFKCKKCGHKQDVDIPMSEYDNLKDKQVCEECEGKLVRVFEAFEGGIEFNCKDMYNTNYGVHASWQ